MQKHSWFKFFLLYLGGVTISLSQLKIVPILTQINQSFHLSLTASAWLMSVFTFSAVFLALPGGGIVSKLGPKKLLIGLMGCLIFGNLLGLLASNYFWLLLSRFIEGIPFSMVIMVGIIFINNWFPDKNRGLATGIWGTFSAAGSLIAMNLFKPLATTFNLKAPWIFIIILGIILLLLYLQFFEKDLAAADKENKGSVLKQLNPIIKNKGIWVLAIAQGSMAFVLYAFITLYPLLFTNFYHVSDNEANFLASLFGLFGVPFGLLAGFLMDRFSRRGKIITLISFGLMTLACLPMLWLNGTFTYILQVFFLSATIMMASSCVMVLAPKTVSSPQLVGYAVSFVNFLYYIGIIIGTPIVTKMIEISWASASVLLTGICLLGTLSILLFILFSRKEKEE
ncbi:MFS transporter [Xylocopilactobacillus apicola]|uniref:MFS transporter n=1 Tax=Xylocopilactobacillus apicola TaxID=2932184 RepID=A0AAU9D9C5_9LACO|nr:MFS transporter [Xylocopilactobacillus apicola]BDR58955.1 MFS transporter [Xylocopilactobacillus apicola]